MYPVEFNKTGSHWSRRFIDWLEGIKLEEQSGTESLQALVRNLKYIRNELLTVSRNIRSLSTHKRYTGAYTRLIELPGIGMLTAMIILTEIGTVSRFKNIDSFRHLSNHAISSSCHPKPTIQQNGLIATRRRVFYAHSTIYRIMPLIYENPGNVALVR